jgi:hypothetical protein
MEADNTKILHISDIESVPSNLKMPTPHFKCLFVCDARRIEANKIDRAMSKLLNQGMVYLCAWGPECERVHDIVDEIVVINEIEKGEKGTIMTTWHDSDSLEEAAEFFRDLAYCDDYFSSTFGAGVVIVVNNSQWKQQIAAVIAQNSA